MVKLLEKPRVVTRGVETDDELRLANDLMAKIHMTDYFEALRWLETCGVGFPNFRREHTRIALWKGELAGSLRMNTETIRIGEARLKTGGFGWVTTVPGHRNKGIGRALVQDTLDYMKKHSYHVSLLFGIPNFYHRFGFVTTLADYSIIVEASEALTSMKATLRLRNAKPGDIPAIQKIHASNDTDTACSVIRSAAHITNQWGWKRGMRVLTNDQGKVMAYFHCSLQADQLHVSEVGASEGGVCPDVLAACAKIAGEEAVGKIRFLTPPPHLFARFLLQYKSTHEMQIVRDCGGMMAFINLPETLESMIPEWESALSRSALRDRRVAVTILVDNTYYRIRANRGAIDVTPFPSMQFQGTNKVSFSSGELMQLMTGYRYVEDILALRRRFLPEEAREFLAVLFPKRYPYVWVHDRF